MSERGLYMAYMRGWGRGSTMRALDPLFAEHTSDELKNAYFAGYGDGMRARGNAQECASRVYGHKPSPFRGDEP